MFSPVFTQMQALFRWPVAVCEWGRRFVLSFLVLFKITTRTDTSKIFCQGAILPPKTNGNWRNVVGSLSLLQKMPTHFKQTFGSQMDICSIFTLELSCTQYPSGIALVQSSQRKNGHSEEYFHLIGLNYRFGFSKSPSHCSYFKKEIVVNSPKTSCIATDTCPSFCIVCLPSSWQLAFPEFSSLPNIQNHAAALWLGC